MKNTIFVIAGLLLFTVSAAVAQGKLDIVVTIDSMIGESFADLSDQKKIEALAKALENAVAIMAEQDKKIAQFVLDNANAIEDLKRNHQKAIDSQLKVVDILCPSRSGIPASKLLTDFDFVPSGRCNR